MDHDSGIDGTIYIAADADIDRPSAMPVRNVKTVGACMSLDIASCFIAAGGVAVAAAAPPELGAASEAMQIGRLSKIWGSQRLTEAMTNPTAISVDLNTRGSVNLVGLSAIFKASPIVQ
jgi:hypothetical protein